MARRSSGKMRSRRAVLALSVLLLAAWSGKLACDMTMTTFVPSPLGFFERAITTAQTLLARDGGNVGIGIRNPAANLDVAGTVKVGNLAADPPVPCVNGAVYYNTAANKFRGCQSGAWRDLGGSEAVEQRVIVGPWTRQDVTATVYCPAGYVVSGGGLTAQNLPGPGCDGPGNPWIRESIPVFDAGANRHGWSTNMRVKCHRPYVVCLRLR